MLLVLNKSISNELDHHIFLDLVIFLFLLDGFEMFLIELAKLFFRSHHSVRLWFV